MYVTSWPLAVVGKLIPVSKRPFSEYFSRIFTSCRSSQPSNRGIFIFIFIYLDK